VAHRVLSLKYRPQTFDDITGQQHVVMSLKGGIRTGRIGHAFLFAGPRGVGKTTTARILAKSLNCIDGPTSTPCQVCQSCKEITLSRSIDVVEIDGASNRGIDEIRNLREGVKYAPLHGKYKVYIIDEVHSLTQDAFNALLKTLEEPPQNVAFIFATTNPTKVPATILSRCQRFMFKRLSVKEITDRLAFIAKKEGIEISPEALHYVAIRADGSIRDGESVLEQLSAFVEGAIQEKDVFDLIGFLGTAFFQTLFQHVIAGGLDKVFITLNQGIERGADPMEVYRGFTQYLRTMLLAKSKLPDELLELNSEEVAAMRDFPVDEAALVAYLETCLDHEHIIKRSVNARIAIELLLSRLALKGDQEKAPGKPASRKATSKPSSDKTYNPGNKSDDPPEVLLDLLQQKNPQLAGVVKKAKITMQKDTMHIKVENEFSHRQIEGRLQAITKQLRDVLQRDITIQLSIEAKERKDSNLVKNIKGLFDSEEVR
jgi:DNA polymerase-3 subunit gamma/tau